MGSYTSPNTSKWSPNPYLCIVFLEYFGLVLDLGRSWGRNPLEKLDETPRKSLENHQKSSVYPLVWGFCRCLRPFGRPAAALEGRGRCRGVGAAMGVVGFEFGWSRSEKM